MIHWMVSFQTLNATTSFSRLINIASETQPHRQYHLEGRHRPNDHYCLFKYTLSGQGVFRDARGEHRVPTGTGFLCRVNDPQTAYYYPPDASEPWEFVYCAFAGESSFGLVADLTSRYGPIFAVPPQNKIIPKLMGYKVFDGTQIQLNFVDSARLVTELLHTLATEAVSSGKNDSESGLVQKAVAFVRDNIHINITAIDVAEALDVSREHLSRVFKRQTSVSPFQYILRQKMILACQLLKKTNCSAKEIAVRLGYDTAGHFGRTFKSVIGTTPGEFRKTGIMPVE